MNQRHLIDKILARYPLLRHFVYLDYYPCCYRYSAEHTIYREVLQNANDAGAQSVEILYEQMVVAADSPKCFTAIVLRNNGRPFDQNDWSRLKRIAEGNPDEQKVQRLASSLTCSR